MFIKFIKKNLVLFVFVFTCLLFNSNKVLAKENLEEKIHSTATIEDDFADNRVLVVLNKGASYNVENIISVGAMNSNDRP